MESLRNEPRTMVFYESPFRLVKTLRQMETYFGPDRHVSVAREISKIHEEHVRGTLDEVAAHFEATPPKGEIVIVVAGAPKDKDKQTSNSLHIKITKNV